MVASFYPPSAGEIVFNRRINSAVICQILVIQLQLIIVHFLFGELPCGARLHVQPDDKNTTF